MFPQLTEILDPEPHTGALNMAIDELLLRSAATPVLRIYRWSQPTVSFGYFGDFSAVAERWPNRDLVRRWTGGGEVLHGDDLTYTLIVPRTFAFARLPPAETYRGIHECLAPLLSDARLTEENQAEPSRSCFENAVRFDLIRRGRKVAGAAQRRTVEGLLHQGSIQATPPLDALRASFSAAFSSHSEKRPLLPAELSAAQQLAAEKYATAAWLHRFSRTSLPGRETIPCASEVAC